MQAGAAYSGVNLVAAGGTSTYTYALVGAGAAFPVEGISMSSGGVISGTANANAPVGTHYFRFNVAALLRGDIKSRFEAYRAGREMGVLTVNDVREQEDLPIAPGEFGDSFLSPANMQLIGPEGALPSPPPPPSSPSAQPEVPPP